jgi:Ca-activated chloride channel family protein
MNDTDIRTKERWKKIILAEIFFWGIIALAYLLIDYSVDITDGETFVFRKPTMLLLLVGIVPIHVIYLKKLDRINALAQGKRSSIYRPKTSFHGILSHLLFTRILVFVLLALAQPSIGREKIAGTIKSLELVICLDISNSMNVKDMDEKESRLTASKRAMTDLINHLSGEKIGVCVFAGSSLVQLPLTSDYEAAKLFIEDISTNLMTQQGTNFSSALETARKMFSPIQEGKAILMITDGEDHDGNALETATQLRKNGIELHLLGVGSSNGGPLPIDPPRPELGYKKSANGKLLISKVDPKLIQELASTANGSYLMSSSSYPSVSQLLTEINQIERTNLRDLAFEARSNNYQLPLGGALLCFLVLGLLKYIELRSSTE